jgi:hypothetical protein
MKHAVWRPVPASMAVKLGIRGRVVDWCSLEGSDVSNNTLAELIAISPRVTHMKLNLARMDPATAKTLGLMLKSGLKKLEAMKHELVEGGGQEAGVAKKLVEIGEILCPDGPLVDSSMLSSWSSAK